MEAGHPAVMLSCFRGLAPQVPPREETTELEPQMIKVLISIRVLNQLLVGFQS